MKNKMKNENETLVCHDINALTQSKHASVVESCICTDNKRGLHVKIHVTQI